MDIPIRNQVGWTTVVSKKTKKEKAKARATIHEDVEDTRTAISELLELDLPVCTNEVPWAPKTSTRRAAMLWSQARKSSFVGTAEGPGYFIYGSFGANGIGY